MSSWRTHRKNTWRLAAVADAAADEDDEEIDDDGDGGDDNGEEAEDEGAELSPVPGLFILLLPLLLRALVLAGPAVALLLLFLLPSPSSWR